MEWNGRMFWKPTNSLLKTIVHFCILKHVYLLINLFLIRCLPDIGLGRAIKFAAQNKFGDGPIWQLWLRIVGGIVLVGRSYSFSDCCSISLWFSSVFDRIVCVLQLVLHFSYLHFHLGCSPYDLNLGSLFESRWIYLPSGWNLSF